MVSSDLCLILSNQRAVQGVSQFIKNLPNVQNEGVLNNVKKTAELEKRYIPFTEPQLFSRWYENKKCYGKQIMTNTNLEVKQLRLNIW